MEPQKFHGRIVVGMLLILLGTLFLLNNYNLFEIPYELFSWEYFFILFGLLFFLLSKNKTVGIVFIAIGLFNLVPELWPLILVLIGAYIIFGKRGRYHSYKLSISHTSDGDKKNYIEQVSLFGGATKIMNSENFKGGNIVSIFGGSDINLSNCKLAEGENILEVTAIFGGVTIIVPQNWNVEIDLIPIFGGFGDKRRKDPNLVYEHNKTLIIKGVAIFGGGEIKTNF